MDNNECFQILSLPQNATLEEAKRTYKDLVKRWHPDRFGGDPEQQSIAQDRLKEINVAYREVVGLLSTSREKGGAPVVRQEAEGPANVREASGKTTSIFQKFYDLLRRRHLKAFEGNTGVNQRRATNRETGSAAFQHRTNAAGGGPPDFQNALRSALRNHPRPVGGGQRVGRCGGRPGERRCGQGRGRGGVSRPYVSPRQGPVDRIEKIRPVGRIKKIGD